MEKLNNENSHSDQNLSQKKSKAGKQKILGNGALMTMITFLATISPISTDLYMPALPTIANEFGVSYSEASVTLIMFFLFMLLGMLFLGPISDKFGRKNMLISCVIVYGIGSFATIFVNTMFLFYISRSVQAIGAGGMLTINTAIIRDCFEGHKRNNTLSLVQSLFVIAPIAAPILGALISNAWGWRTIFVILSCFSLVLLVFALLFTECLDPAEKKKESLGKSFATIFKVCKNGRFLMLLLMVSVFGCPFMIYLGTASAIYENIFGLDQTMFSLFFAGASLMSIIGPILNSFLEKRVKASISLTGVVVLGAIACALMFTFGHTGPAAFMLCFVPYFIGNSFLRPFATYLLLKIQPEDAGSASAVMNFSFNLVGVIAMAVVAAVPGDYILIFNGALAACVIIAGLIWVIIRSQKWPELNSI